MAITKVTTPELIDLPTTISNVETNTDGVVLPKGTTSGITSIEYLVVAGGGGGGYNYGGGGGAGGYLTGSANFSVEVNHTINVGIPGAAGSSANKGGIGGDSQFSNITSKGGGGGGSLGSSDKNGLPGGSGGGGAGNNSAASTGIGGTATVSPTQGNNGGNGFSGSGGAAGGGGGAGGAGGTGSTGQAGAAGLGLTNSITGTSTFYAGGGGANANGANSNGGSSIGGNGGNPATNGAVNTGSGGGGSGTTSGAGGSGIVILRTVSTTTATFSSGVTYTLDNTTVAGQNIYKITATTNSSQTVTFSSTVLSNGRPVTGGSYILEDGEFRYNNVTKKVEYYDGASWFTLTSTPSVPQAGTTATCNYPTTATALYQLNDNVTDTCGNYNGTASNLNAYVTGKFGNAADFNGSSSVIDLPTLGLSPSGSSMSFSFWVKGNVQGVTTDNSMISLWGDLNLDLRVDNYAPNVNKINIVYYSSGFAAIDTTFTLTVGVWTNFVLTYVKGTGFVVYENGVSSGALGFTGTLGSQSGSNKIGASGAGGGFFNGSIDQVRIFPSALTSAQVTALAEETAP